MPYDPSSETSSTYTATEPSHVWNAPSVNKQQRSRRPRGPQGPIDFQLSRGKSTIDGSVNTTDSQVIQGQGTYRLEDSDGSDGDLDGGVLFDPDSENFRRRQERKRRR